LASDVTVPPVALAPAPLEAMPYSEKVEPATRLLEPPKVIEVMAAVFLHRPTKAPVPSAVEFALIKVVLLVVVFE
jgi:hypothetical protein